MSPADGLLVAVLCGLAGWRAASLLVYEDGPWGLFYRLREAVAPPGDEPMGFWALLLSCIWCCSVWTTAAALLFWYLFPPVVILGAACALALVAERLSPAGRA